MRNSTGLKQLGKTQCHFPPARVCGTALNPGPDPARASNPAPAELPKQHHVPCLCHPSAWVLMHAYATHLLKEGGRESTTCWGSFREIRERRSALARLEMLGKSLKDFHQPPAVTSNPPPGSEGPGKPHSHIPLPPQTHISAVVG